MIGFGQIRHSVAVLGGAALLSAHCHSVDAKTVTFPPKIDEATAERLVSEANFNDERHVDDLEYDGPAANGDFFQFTLVTSYGPSFVAGFSAVNPWTGDVWDLWSCKRLSTPLLRRSQARIHALFTGAERKRYPALRRLKPFCT